MKLNHGPLWVFLLALLLTLLNAVKPLHIDDTAYYYFAAHIAEHPLDPYGFEIFWYQEPQPANEILAPPVLLYWWALAIKLFGNNSFLWKVWLLPFSLLFAWALHNLFRRFARGLEIYLLILTVLSPVFLPSLNLMLDIPALALGLSALAIFMRANERGSFLIAAFAGLLAGLAMQTKYTAFPVPAVMLLFGLTAGKFRLACVAILMAGLTFAAWEVFLLLSYGTSHFLYHLRAVHEGHVPKYLLVTPLLCTFGATFPALALVNLAALKVSRRTIVFLATTFILGYFTIAVVPEPYTESGWTLSQFEEEITVSRGVLITIGAVICATMGCAVAVIGRCPRSLRRPYLHVTRHPEEIFLIGWLLLEVVAYFMLSPFPAVRRAMGVIVVATLIAGRLGSRTCRSSERKALLKAIVAGSVVLAFAYYALDLREAFVQKEAAEASADMIQRAGGGTVWYVGHWGFQFYAEKGGMKPLVPGKSQIRSGDWIVIPEQRIDQQEFETKPAMLPAFALSFSDPVRVILVPCFYGGLKPFERHDEPRLSVDIYYVTKDFTP